MKLELKPIKLDRYNTFESIIKMQYFYKIGDDLKKIILKEKINEMNPIELYNVINKIFYIKLDKNDYINILSIKNNKHYNKIIRVKTTMFDLNGNNISYKCMVSSKVKIDDNARLDKNKLRKLTNSKDILLLDKYRLSDISYLGRIEKEEPFLLQNLNIENSNFDEDSELFIYIPEYIQKKGLKNINIRYELINYYSKLKKQISDAYIPMQYDSFCLTEMFELDIPLIIKDLDEHLKSIKDRDLDDAINRFMNHINESNYRHPASKRINNISL